MADLFIVKERLKFSLMLTSVGIVLGALATWHFYGQIEFESDRSPFLLAAVITGALVVAWFGLLLFFLAANGIMNSSGGMADRFGVRAWWMVRVVLIVGVIVAAGIYISRYSDMAESEFELIRIGHTDALVERIRQQPALLEKKDSADRTLLQFAYQENHPEAVAALINLGVPAESILPDGGNPVIASLDNLPMLGTLLECRFNPGQPDAEGIPAVHHVVERNLQDALVLLVEAGANVDGRDRISRTALMRAVESDAVPMVGKLIELGAGVNAFDQRGDTALHIAVRRRTIETIQQLLNAEADPTVFNFIHMTPLHIAALAGQDQLIALFVENPELVDLRDDGDRTPLDSALQARKYETATLLISSGADLNRIREDGTTLLHEAIIAKDYRTARFLIRNGSDATIPDNVGRTALDLIRNKQLSGLQDLLTARDNPEAATNSVDSVENR